MSLMGWIVVVFVLALVNFFIGMNSLKGFLASHSAISSSQDLEEFKGMVRQQMYQALLQLGLLGLTVVLGLYGIVSGRLSGMEILLFIVINVAIIAAGKLGKGLEDKARTLSVSDENLNREYIDVCEAWVRKPLPDF